MKGGKLSQAQLKRIRSLLGRVPFAGLMGIQLDEVGFGSARLFLDVRNELKQNHGLVHGGAIASLIDTATAFAVLTVIPARARAATVDLTIKYLRPLTSGRAIASATVIKAGRRLLTISAEVVDEDGTSIAAAISTYIKS